MRTQPFQTLRRILDVGSFSQAAQLENMTLSALSMQMKALEAELGVTLFDRQARPPRLTPLGRAIAETSSAFSAAEAQIRALCAAERGLAGRFTVGFIPTAGVRIMPPFLANVARAAPQAVLTTASGLSEELSQRVADGRLDAAVVTGVPELPANLAAHGLGRERMLGIGPTGSGLNMLQELDFLHFQPASGIGRLITTILRQSDIAPPRTIIIDNVEAVVECVRQGIGWSILPEPDIARYAPPGAVAPLRAFGERELVLLTRQTADPLMRETFLACAKPVQATE